MTGVGSTATFSVPESFDQALASVREALAQAGMESLSVLNVSQWIDRRLGVATPSYTVLRVRPRVLPSERALAAVLPFHVAVSARGQWSQVHIPERPNDHDRSIPPAAAELLGRVHRDLSDALSRIAMRQSAVSTD